jgi:glycosyltransferase involved in cell wall biosynthesis
LKIAYIGQMADVATENGISKKIQGQTAAWIEQGHQVRYFSLTPTTRVWSGFTTETDLTARGGILNRGQRSRHMVTKIRSWDPEVIYFRYGYHSSGLPRLFREIPTVGEMNSDDLQEYPLTLSWEKVVYHRLSRKRILGELASMVAVTGELKDRFLSFGKAIEVIGNGIDLEEISSLPGLDSDSPTRLVFVGNTGSPWHGLDRVGEIKRLLPACRIDIVGCNHSDWYEATGTKSPPVGMIFHGMLPRAKYEPLLRDATAAIGTLGLFRKSMNEACPLKVREYLAYGLPVIGAYSDTDVPNDADYFLRLPNSKEPLDGYQQPIRDFIDRWATRRVPRSAIAHLDVKVKERQRLEFMSRFARKKAP